MAPSAILSSVSAIATIMHDEGLGDHWADRDGLLGAHGYSRKSSPVRTSSKTRACNGSGQTIRRLASEDDGKHPSAGRIETMSTFVEQAEKYVILIEGGPPSNYSAWTAFDE